MIPFTPLATPLIAKYPRQGTTTGRFSPPNGCNTSPGPLDTKLGTTPTGSETGSLAPATPEEASQARINLSKGLSTQNDLSWGQRLSRLESVKKMVESEIAYLTEKLRKEQAERERFSFSELKAALNNFLQKRLEDRSNTDTGPLFRDIQFRDAFLEFIWTTDGGAK